MRLYRWLICWTAIVIGDRYRALVGSGPHLRHALTRGVVVRPGWWRVRRAPVAVALAAVLCAMAAEAAADEQCGAQLTVELTPDVPDAGDDGFLSSLLNNQTDYRLDLLREDDTSVVELNLSGPGPEYRCENVIETMRKDARVLSIRVDSTASSTSALLSAGDASARHPSESGLGALYWAAHHPRQAWRVLLPIQSNPATANESLNKSDPREPLRGI